MAKKARRLPLKKTLARVDEMCELILEEVKNALAVEAALGAGNDIVTSQAHWPDFYGANCYNTVRQGMSLLLALMLAKIFEAPPPRRGETRAARWNRSDVASVPLLVRLLRQRRVQKALVERSRRWTPKLMSLSEAHAQACRENIAACLAAYAQLRSSPSARERMNRLSRFRNKMLAHILLGEALKVVPSYADLFCLMDAARETIGRAKLAVAGDNLDLAGVEAEFLRMSKAFWNPALKSAAVAGQHR